MRETVGWFYLRREKAPGILIITDAVINLQERNGITYPVRSVLCSANEQVLLKRTALFWIITQRIVVICYRRFGTTYRSHLKGQDLVNNQLDAQFFFLYVYFNSLHVSCSLVLIIRRINCSSFPTCVLDGHLHRVTHAKCCIDTIDSPNDEHEVARNM
jgi:hypothetical protein